MTTTLVAQGVGDAAGDALRSVVTFLPKLVGFLLVLLIGWFVARLLRTGVRKVLEHVHFDRAVQHGGIGDALARTRFDAAGLVAQIVYYAVLLIALQIAFGLFGSNPVSALLTDIVAWLPRAVVAIIIIVVAAAIARAVRDIASRAMGGLSYGPTVAKIASWFIIGIGVIAALNQIGIATTVTTPILITVLATVGGIAVVGVGGGLVRPMQARWDRWLDKAEEEAPRVRAETEAYRRTREDERQRASMAEPTVVSQPVPTGAGPAPAPPPVQQQPQQHQGPPPNAYPPSSPHAQQQPENKANPQDPYPPQR
jgi:mechanosensitive ion channel-like protein